LIEHNIAKVFGMEYGNKPSMKASALFCTKKYYLSITYDLIWNNLILRSKCRIPKFKCAFFILFAFCFSSIYTKNLTIFSCEPISKIAVNNYEDCPKFDFAVNFRIFPTQAAASFFNNNKFNAKRTGCSFFQGDIALCTSFLSDNFFETIAILRTHISITVFPLQEYQARAPPSVL